VPELSFVTHIARTVYGLEPQSIEALEPYCSDQRGIYQVRDAQDGVWMFRLLRSVYLSESLLHAGPITLVLLRGGVGKTHAAASTQYAICTWCPNSIPNECSNTFLYFI